jgi:hypothetical protein
VELRRPHEALALVGFVIQLGLTRWSGTVFYSSLFFGLAVGPDLQLGLKLLVTKQRR